MKTTRSNSTTKVSPASIWLGLRDYESAQLLQKQTWTAIQNGSSQGEILGLEHPETITLGSRGESLKDLRPEAGLADGSPSLPIPFIQTDRGGQATLHSPGQLVIYPVLSLREWGVGVREFVEVLQKSTQMLLQDFGIESWPAEGAGLMTAKGKIAFIGLRIDRGICRHGLSLNVKNDLGLFRQIRSCGIEQAELTRIADLGPKPEELQLEALFTSWVQYFALNLSNASPNDCR